MQGISQCNCCGIIMYANSKIIQNFKHSRPYWKNNQRKNGWECGSSGSNVPGPA
jgi:molybdopterin synthase catalytic subunit